MAHFFDKEKKIGQDQATNNTCWPVTGVFCHLMMQQCVLGIEGSRLYNINLLCVCKCVWQNERWRYLLRLDQGLQGWKRRIIIATKSLWMIILFLYFHFLSLSLSLYLSIFISLSIYINSSIYLSMEGLPFKVWFPGALSHSTFFAFTKNKSYTGAKQYWIMIVVQWKNCWKKNFDQKVLGQIMCMPLKIY